MRECHNRGFGQPFDAVTKGIDTAETVFDGRSDKILNILAFGEHCIEEHGPAASRLRCPRSALLGKTGIEPLTSVTRS
jgi:hypothetical protein